MSADARDADEVVFRELLAATRNIEPSKVPAGHSLRICEHILGDFIRKMGITARFVDTYSAERRSVCVAYLGATYIVIDHSVSELFTILNYAFAAEAPDDGFTAGLLQRTLAEACRSAGLGRLREYAFFIRRALEAKPFVRIVQSGGRHSWDNYWQDVFILGHELGHALPPDGGLYEHLRFVAQNNISLAVDESIDLTTSALIAALDGAEGGRAQADFFDVDLDALAASVLQGGVDVAAVEARLRDYVATERFIEEVACDAFGFAVIRVVLSARGEAEDAELRADFVESVLLAAYRTFLNTRFSAYAAEVVKMRAEAAVGPINPLLLDTLIEFSLRGRLAARSVVGVYAQMGGSAPAADFDRELGASSRVHVERVFKPFNDLLERTVFNRDFLAALDGRLEEDGFSPQEFEENPFVTLRKVEAFWRLVAQ